MKILALTRYCHARTLKDYENRGGYSGLKKALTLSAQEVIQQVESSGLKGRGGAGFSTGLKWKSLGHEHPRFVVCNADEGEPGTFKDRLLLESAPHLVLEGILIASYALEAEKAFIYIRGEYPEETRIIQKAIDEVCEAGLNRFPGRTAPLEIEVKRGGGSYVVGDETALLNSLMGYRGNPWLKPPFPTQKGLWGSPTAVNNVETLACVSYIFQESPEAFKAMGTPACPGPKLFCLSGHIKKPGVYEAPLGIALSDLLEMAGGVSGKLKAVQIGGLAGPVYDDSALSFHLDFESMKKQGGSLGSGAIIVMNDSADMTHVLESEMKFFSDESCGKCFPCRYGTRQLDYMAEKMRKGEGNPEFIDLMEKTVETMKKTSLCPFGQSVIAPVKGIFKFFRAEIEAAMKGGHHG